MFFCINSEKFLRLRFVDWEMGFLGIKVFVLEVGGSFGRGDRVIFILGF